MTTDNLPAVQPNTAPLSKAEPSSSTAMMDRRAFLIEMERLQVLFPRSELSPQQWKLLFQTYWEDLSRLTIEQFRDAIRRYRQNPESKFFPTPGQLLAASKSPFDTDLPCHKKPAFKDTEPQLPMAAEFAKGIIEKTRAKYGWPPTEEQKLAAIKAEHLNRPPLVMTPELVEREKRLAPERRAALERALAFKEGDTKKNPDDPRHW